MAVKRVLFLAAEPSDEVRLRLGQEQREIRNVLRLASARDSIEFHERFAARPADLTQALHDVRPHVVHFSGHGSSSGDLCFEDDAGVARPVHPEALASVFRLVRDEVEAVILNACYSEPQALAIGRSIEQVIGMGSAIADDAAIRFSAGFYKALGARRSYLDCFNFGVAEVRLHGMPDHLTPVLHARRVVGPAHLRADGVADPQIYAKFNILKDRYGRSSEPAVYIDPAQVSGVRDLTEILYRFYLRDLVAPFTYGTEWIISGDWNDFFLVAPATWIKQHELPVRNADASWDEFHVLADFGISSGTSWNIRLQQRGARPLVRDPFAVASSDPMVLQILRNEAKGRFLFEERLEEVGSPTEMGAESSVVVLEDWSNSGLGGRLFVVRDGELPQGAQYYLRRH